MAILTLTFCSCQDWGEWDEEAGNQSIPSGSGNSFKLIAEYPLTGDLKSIIGEGIADGEAFSYNGGSSPEYVDDSKELKKKVIYQENGYLRFPNSLRNANLENGASISFWVKLAEADPSATILSLEYGGAQVSFTANAGLSYNGAAGWVDVNNPNSGLTNAIGLNQWRFISLTFSDTGFMIYIDGDKKYDTTNHQSITGGNRPGIVGGNFDYSNMLNAVTKAPYIYLGYDEESHPKKFYLSRLRIYANQITDSEASGAVGSMTPVYFNSFDSADGLTVVGAGEFIKWDGQRFGQVFKNVNGAKNTNYLMLPSDVLSHSSKTQELTIGVWVSSKYAGLSTDYPYAPLFTAYGNKPSAANSWPMFALQYRGVAQINCAGYTDFTPAANDKGINTEYNSVDSKDDDWLKDKEWHYYTATLTATSCKIYFDGEIANSWTEDGSDGHHIAGLFSNGADLRYITLGGNQAWGWIDNDPGFMFDDIAIYNMALTQEDIKEVIAKKMAIPEEPLPPTPVYMNTFEDGQSDGTQPDGSRIIGGGSFVDSRDNHFGKVFQNIIGGRRTNYLLLPEDIMSHSATSKEMSISMWVNATAAIGSEQSYGYTPLFTAHGVAPNPTNNGNWPMFALYTRGTLQLNNAGWCNFEGFQNTEKNNTEYLNDLDWLKDGEWHFYTATLTGTTANVYFDGVLKNSWVVDGTSDNNIIEGAFIYGGNYRYNTLGGNQAFDWPDDDPGFAFDDFAIYDVVLTPEQIKQIIADKTK